MVPQGVSGDYNGQGLVGVRGNAACVCMQISDASWALEVKVMAG